MTSWFDSGWPEANRCEDKQGIIPTDHQYDMTSSAPVQIGNLIHDLASRYRWNHRFSRRAIWKSWLEIAGDAIAANAWPLRFIERDILVIAVSDSVWIQQLSLQKLTIIKALNLCLPPESNIRDIRFKIENIDDVRKRQMPTSLSTVEKTDDILIPDDVKKEMHEHADALTEPVKDGELRKILQNAYLKSMRKAASS